MKHGIEPFVKAFKHATLAEAVEFARLQEEALAATHKPFKHTSSFPYKPIQAFLVNSSKPNNQLSLTKFNPSNYKNPRHIPAIVCFLVTILFHRPLRDKPPYLVLVPKLNIAVWLMLLKLRRSAIFYLSSIVI